MTQVPRTKSTPILRWLPWVLLIVVVVAAVVLNSRGRRADGEPGSGEGPPPGAVEALPGETGPDSEVGQPDAAGDQALAESERKWQAVTGQPPVWPERFSTPVSCENATQALEVLCAHLDGLPYVREYGLEGGTFGFLATISSDLEARRPVVAGELSRFGNILHNVSHLYRVLGEKRMIRLAEMIALEPDMAEPMAMALYRWMLVRERCEDGTPRGMNLKAQYDYAAFLLGTIGGQAYLRRRAPQLEALASFYSLMVLDAAVESGYNPQGVDLRKDISRTRYLMATGSLLFHERYVELLDGMDRRWEKRSATR